MPVDLWNKHKCWPGSQTRHRVHNDYIFGTELQLKQYISQAPLCLVVGLKQDHRHGDTRTFMQKTCCMVNTFFSLNTVKAGCLRIYPVRAPTTQTCQLCAFICIEIDGCIWVQLWLPGRLWRVSAALVYISCVFRRKDLLKNIIMN